jgi:hypothetical protein
MVIVSERHLHLDSRSAGLLELFCVAPGPQLSGLHAQQEIGVWGRPTSSSAKCDDDADEVDLIVDRSTPHHSQMKLCFFPALVPPVPYLLTILIPSSSCFTVKSESTSRFSLDSSSVFRTKSA